MLCLETCPHVPPKGDRGRAVPSQLQQRDSDVPTCGARLLLRLPAAPVTPQRADTGN